MAKIAEVVETYGIYLFSSQLAEQLLNMMRDIREAKQFVYQLNMFCCK